MTTNGIGLALSGGGSRAAAFHRGTLRGLQQVGLLQLVDALSTVSGGSVFGAAWMAASARGETFDSFMNNARYELSVGFTKRAFGPRLLLTAWPGYTRTNLLASAFDKAFFKKAKLEDLPDSPRLCMNATVLNSAQVGKFGKRGFKTRGLVPAGSQTFAEWMPLPKFKLATAAAASAAFPVGLPPIYLKRGREVPEGWGSTPELQAQRLFALTDGGVLENLGIQTLLNEQSEFFAWDIVSSDASCDDQVWTPGGARARMRGLLMGALSAPVLERVGNVMHDKQDRHMRHHAVDEATKSWLVRGLLSPEVAAGTEMRTFLAGTHARPERRLLMVRLSQTWNHVLDRIPEWRLKAFAESYQIRTRTLPPPVPKAGDLPGREAFLTAVGVDLSVAWAIYRAMGGDSKVAELNRIRTHFDALTEPELDALHDHARWQVHALHELYWKDISALPEV
jgi:predicted acylesterase/phospholipase RssA